MCSAETCSRVGVERGLSKEESVHVSSALSRGRSDLGSSTAFCPVWQVGISPLWDIIFYNRYTSLATWYDDNGSSIYHLLWFFELLTLKSFQVYSPTKNVQGIKENQVPRSVEQLCISL